jgi:hypothetical protein
MSMAEKKKKSALKRFFLFLVLLIILVPLAAELVFFLMRLEPGTVIPDNFTVYATAPNPVSLAEKVLDHESLPAILAAPGLAPLNPPVNSLKTSGLLQNRWARLLLRGKAAAALLPGTGSAPGSAQGFGGGSLIAAWDSGFLAPFLRFLPFVAGRLNIPNLYYVQGSLSRFEYRAEGTVYYLAARRNLMIVSNDERLFTEAFGEDGASYSPGKSMTGKGNDLSLLVSSRTVTNVLGENNPMLQRAFGQAELPAFIETGLVVERSRLNVKVTARVNTSNEAFAALLGRNSSAPALMNVLPDTAQYCTEISAGSFEELLNAVSVVSPDGLASTMATADKTARSLLGMSLEEILYSWTDGEFAVFGLEEKPAPVFAAKIEDEEKRKEVFERAFSSLFLKEDASLVLDGNRIPQIGVPAFIDAVLRLIGVNVPSPYYVVHEGWLFISESPENLVATVTAIRQNNVLPKTELWKNLSSLNDAASSATLFYSLDRSLPFFLKGGSPAAALLRLYREGLLRISVKDSVVSLELSVIPGAGRGVEAAPGYPLALGGRTGNRVFAVSNAGGSEWRILATRGNSALSVNPADHVIHELKGSDPVWVIPAAGLNPKTLNEGCIWVLSSKGLVTLVNGDLEAVRGFPVITGLKPTSAPAAFAGRLYIAADEGDKGLLYEMNSGGQISRLGPDYSSAILSPPEFIDNNANATGDTASMAFYPKSFLGEIFVTSLDGQARPGWPVYASNIAYGTPLLFSADMGGAAGRPLPGSFLLAFITMSGELTVYGEDGSLLPGFPQELPGVFYLQPVWDGSFLWAVSEDGVVYQCDLSGGVLNQRIPELSVKEDGWIGARDVDGDGAAEIFISGEGNALYGFSRALTMLDGFPLPVWGRPVFEDFDGGGKTDIAGVGMDNKLYRWSFK